MAIEAMAVLGIGITALWLYRREASKSYSKARVTEATRYFNGSVVSEDDPAFYTNGVYTQGLAVYKDPKTNEVRFAKQAKMCDSALLRK